jgi:hypothetical protein
MKRVSCVKRERESESESVCTDRLQVEMFVERWGLSLQLFLQPEKYDNYQKMLKREQKQNEETVNVKVNDL